MKAKVDYANNGNVRMDAGFHFKNKVNSNNLYFLIVACFALLVVFSGCKKDNNDEDETIIIMTTAREGEVTIYMAGSGTVTIDWGDGTEIKTHILSSDSYYFFHTYSNSHFRTITIIGKNITYLNCSGNQLTSLDVSKNTKMTHLECQYNKLTSLNVSGAITLTHLFCWNNELKSLDVSKNTELINFWCHNNQLTSLDVSKNPKLLASMCNNNQLASLDLSKNTALAVLYCNNNRLDADALNALFGTLHSKPPPQGFYFKNINIGNNPGTNDPELNTSIATAKGWVVYY